MPDPGSLPDSPGVQTTAVEPPRVWPVFVALAAAVALQLALGIGIAVTEAVRAALNGQSDAKELERAILALAHSPPFLAIAFTMTLVTLGSAALIGARLSPVLSSERLRWRTPNRADLVPVLLSTMAGWGMGVTATFAMALFASPEKPSMMVVIGRAGSSSSPALFAVLTLICVLAGGAEELFFRGYMQTRLSQRTGPLVGVVVTALFFGLTHFDLWQGMFAFGFGLVLGWVTERTGSVAPAMLAHMANNAVAMLAPKLVPQATYGSGQLWFAAAVAILAVIALRSVFSARQAASAAP